MLFYLETSPPDSYNGLRKEYHADKYAKDAMETVRYAERVFAEN